MPGSAVDPPTPPRLGGLRPAGRQNTRRVVGPIPLAPARPASGAPSAPWPSAPGPAGGLPADLSITGFSGVGVPDASLPAAGVPTSGSAIPDSKDADVPPAEPGADSETVPVTTVQSRLALAWRAVTGRGRAVALVAVVSLVVGVATGWREWVGIAAALAVLLLAAVLMALGRSSCTAELELPRTRFDVDEPGWATLLIRNSAGSRMLPLQMELEIRSSAGGADADPDRGRESRAVRSTLAAGVTSDAAVTGNADAPASATVATDPAADTWRMSIPSIPGGGSHTVHIPLPTEHRAVLALGPLRAVRGDVFGLIRRVVQWPVRREVFVRPRIARPTGSLPGFVRDLEGDESTTRTASDLSFHTLREYVPGDDRRFIHWKSSARNGTLQVREFLQTHRSLVAVILSGNRDEYHWGSGNGGSRAGGPGNGRRGGDAEPADVEFELAVSCAASMVADLVRRRRDVLTAAAGTAIGGATADSVLDRFCAVQAQPAASPNLAFVTRQVLRRNPRASVVILVFGSLADPARVRAAFRACPPGATVLALRARVESSPAPLRFSGPDAEQVLTLPDIDALPGALRAAG